MLWLLPAPAVARRVPFGWKSMEYMQCLLPLLVKWPIKSDCRILIVPLLYLNIEQINSKLKRVISLFGIALLATNRLWLSYPVEFCRRVLLRCLNSSAIENWWWFAQFFIPGSGSTKWSRIIDQRILMYFQKQIISISLELHSNKRPNRIAASTRHSHCRDLGSIPSWGILFCLPRFSCSFPFSPILKHNSQQHTDNTFISYFLTLYSTFSSNTTL